MNVKNIIYPYPVLNSEKDDYLDPTLELDVRCEYDEENLNMEYDIIMNNSTLNNLIRNNKVQYAICFEDIKTSYRTVHFTKNKKGKISIPLSKLYKKLEFSLKITTTKDINNLTITGLVDDFKGNSFNFLKGNILGYSSGSIINIEREYGKSINKSIFKIVKKENIKHMKVDLGNDEKIIIFLDKKSYDNYFKISKNEKFNSINTSSIILPALVYIFGELKQNIEDYQEKEWCKAIFKNYESKYKNELILEEKTSIELAQEVLEDPISKSLYEIFGLYDIGEE